MRTRQRTSWRACRRTRILCKTKIMKEKLATREDFEPFKDKVNENRTEISPTQEDQEDVQPVRTVRVPAHQILDRKFVKIERKRRKRKDYQTDCKTS